MAGYITLGVVILGMIVEITPVKINPISWIGKHFNKNIDDKLKEMQKTYEKNQEEILNKLNETNLRIDGTNERIDGTDIADIRTRIATIATIIKNGGLVTDDQYNCVFKDIDTWGKYHQKYPDLNGIVNISIEIIQEEYKKSKKA